MEKVTKAAEKNHDDPPRPVTDHLRDLRNAFLRSAIAAALGIGLCFWQSPKLFEVLLWPLRRGFAEAPRSVFPLGTLQTLAPTEIFLMNLRLAFVGGLLFASPWLLREIWVFVAPGLTRKERRAVFPAFLLGLLFFLAGLIFAYTVVLPLMLRFFIAYNQQLGLAPQWTLQGYLSFCVSLSLAFGLCFELPMVVWILSALGLLSTQTLKRRRKIAVLVLFIAAAAVTPTGDPLTMLLLALPLCLLYEIGIFLSQLSGGKKQHLFFL